MNVLSGIINAHYYLTESVRQWRRVPILLHLDRARAVLKRAPILFGLPMTACDLAYNKLGKGINQGARQSVIEVNDIENDKIKEVLLKQNIRQIVIEIYDTRPGMKEAFVHKGKTTAQANWLVHSIMPEYTPQFAAYHPAHMLIILKRAALEMEEGIPCRYFHPYSKLVGGIQLVKEGPTLKVSGVFNQEC